MFSILILVFVLILGMCNNQENFVLPEVHYEWGLHENKHNLKKEIQWQI